MWEEILFHKHFKSFFFCANLMMVSCALLLRRDDKKLVTLRGSYPKFTNWNVGQPDDYDGKENCVQIIAQGHHSGSQHSTLSKWNDQHCQKKYNYMCEIKPPISEYQTFSYLERGSHNRRTIPQFSYYSLTI